MKQGHPSPLHRIIGVMLTVGGLWHAAAPWIFGYSHLRPAVTSDLASGLTLALVGVGLVAVGWSWLLIGLAGAIGVWVLTAPQLLGVAGPQFIMLEAAWGGPLTIALTTIAALEHSFGRLDATIAEQRQAGPAPA
jgi:hypothetical protein